MSEGRPVRMQIAVLPLIDHLDPRIHVELKIVTGGNSEMKERQDYGQRRDHDDEQRPRS